ncbi:hypothetical protein [Roseovarius amoyensis]|nr:hypothetical protein [Roseovarius amoyensis]
MAAIILLTVRFMHPLKQKHLLVILLENMIFARTGGFPPAPARNGNTAQ